MSRSKKHAKDDLEALRSENRELKATVKDLERQLKKLNKEFKIESDNEDLVKSTTQEKKPKTNRCDKCERGIVKTTDLGPRIIRSCTICEYRQVIKNDSSKS